MIDGDGLPLAAITTKANAHDLQSALKTVDNFKIGNQHRRPKRLRADKGYDSVAFRRQLRQRHIKPAIDNREFKHRRLPARCWNDQKEIRYSPRRWSVEQRIACLDQARRLDFLFERTRDAYEAFLTLARIRCYLKILRKSRKPPQNRVFR